MPESYDTIIAGAGPVGLLLASELAMAGASVLILERDPDAHSAWKTMPMGFRGLTNPSVEALYRRGLFSNFFDAADPSRTLAKTPGFRMGGHFAGILLDANKFELDRWKYRLPGPSLLSGAVTLDKLERVLMDRATTLGVVIQRGCAVERIDTSRPSSVTVWTGNDQSFTSKYLVGCDGGRSTVRKAAGFDFPGTDAKFTGYVVQCDFDHPERLERGFYPTNNGMYIVGPTLGLYLVDFDGGAFDRSQDITLEHVQDVMKRVSGRTDVKITQVHLASAFTDRSRQTSTYRKGRILLAGDAAHIHPPLGGQGLNVGLGDAMNLGWKLATAVRLGGADSLLDSYEAERHPVAAGVIESTRAQVATLQPDAHGAALRKLFREVVATVDGANLFMGRMWGLEQRYPPVDGKAHDLVGCSAPDFEFDDGTRLGARLESGLGLLMVIEDGKDAMPKNLLEGKRVSLVKSPVKNSCGLGALLIRPDGVVAWAVDAGCSIDVHEVEMALQQWSL